MRCAVISYDEDSCRFLLTALYNNVIILGILPSLISFHQRHPAVYPLLNHRVVVVGTSKPEYNGQKGVAIDAHTAGPESHPSLSRYSVKLDGGEVFKLRVVNVACGNEAAQAAANHHQLYHRDNPQYDLSYRPGR